MRLLKHFIKKYLWKWVFYRQIYGQGILLNRQYLDNLKEPSSSPKKSFNIFTTAGEDEILLDIFAKTGQGNRIFIDIGSNDCINSNCANLAFHHGWSGIFIDGNKETLERGKYIYSRYFKKESAKFSFIHSIVTPGNINEILNTALQGKTVDILSIDLDGNDYFIWDKIDCINPRVVVTEVQVEKGNTEYIPEYSSVFEKYESGIPKGASPLSMKKLAESKGYRLVAVNKGCYNMFFVRNDCFANLEEITLDEVLKNV